MCTDVAFMVFLVIPLLGLGVSGCVLLADWIADNYSEVLGFVALVVGPSWWVGGVIAVFLNFAGPKVC